jgi:superfamily II DNA or RNA helicase
MPALPCCNMPDETYVLTANCLVRGKVSSTESTWTDEGLEPGATVRLRGDPSRIGKLERISTRGGRKYCRVRFFPDTLREVPRAQIERQPERAELPVNLLAQGRFSDPGRLRQVLAHVRLTGRLADIIYSMEATNTEFYPYQFKPVLKMLSSPSGGLLIADEVGLGKTIEAGLIWTELRARYGYQRLLVVCPKMLCGKWRNELNGKFGLDARIQDAAGLKSLIEDQSQAPRAFVAICGLQGLQPPRGWDEDGSETYQRASAELARLLDQKGGQDPLFDLVVVDEAHHLRNPETQRNRLGQMLQPLAQHMLLLSATPIHLRSRDLYSLLKLLDPNTFRDETVLQQFIDANRPLIAARDSVLRHAPKAELLLMLNEAGHNALLQDSQQLASLRSEIERMPDSFSISDRTRIAERLEGINLLANVVNRTRRRDVQELRVLRDVHARFADMTPAERDVYDRVIAEVESYASERDAMPGFLLATAERLLASCIPAAVGHWKARDSDPGYEDEENIENSDGRENGDVGPLVERLARLCRDLPTPEELARHDTKFEEFASVIRAYLSDAPNEKVVVFSTFRATLAYLGTRLKADGIPTVTIHGEVPDRDAVLARFAEDATLRVLLSSEVGSEGIDLQFCRAVVNYDLPWNPMRIEQRIGRVDRLGQQAESVSVINMLHRDTIDERIFGRLYARLELIKTSLGDFEEVLGEIVRELTRDLLSQRLTPQQEADRIDQASQAIETTFQQTAALEQQAGSLIAHGDAILQRISAAHANHRFIGARDLAAYLSDSLSMLYPGCVVRDRQEQDLYDIQLSQDARIAFADWLDQQRLQPFGRLHRDTGAVACRLGRPSSHAARGPVEAVTQSHPFVRFVGARLAETEAPRLRPAIAARVASASLTAPLEPGYYVALACLWSFSGQTEQERIAYAAANLSDAGLLTDEGAERLILDCAQHGSLWLEARTRVDCAAAAETAENRLLEHLARLFAAEEGDQSARQADRVSVQLTTLERQYERDRMRLETIVQRQRDQGRPESVIRLREGQLRALEERVRRRRNAIEHARPVTATEEQFAALLIEVLPL